MREHRLFRGPARMIPSWLLSRLTPAGTAFLASLLLSCIAIVTTPAVNRDGLFYADAARAFLSDGLSGAMQVFNWPCLPILMAGLSFVTGAAPDTSGFILNAFFFAGTCALLVKCSERLFPQATWMVCLTLLALPGLNHYRDEIIREYGCWFFILLATWLAMQWNDRNRIVFALASQFALCVAALFRPEALALFAGFAAWQWCAAPKGRRLSHTLTLCGLPLLGLGLLGLYFIFGKMDTGHRLASDLSRISGARFAAKAEVLASGLIPYARDQAKSILFLGSLALIPLKYIKQLGIFIIPAAYLLFSPQGRSAISRLNVFNWLFLAHLLVLGIFVLDMQFLAGRYVIVLQVFSAPLLGYALWKLCQDHPNLQALAIPLALLLMLTNVVSTTPAKTHYQAAGQWLAKQDVPQQAVFSSSGAIEYYAGWRMSRTVAAETMDDLLPALNSERYSLWLIEKRHEFGDLENTLQRSGFEIVARFQAGKAGEIIAARRAPKSGG